MRRYIDPMEHAAHILQKLQKGVLLSTQADGKMNSMAIAWGMLGIEWNRPIFTALVRENRFSRTLLDKSMEFTVNVPLAEIDAEILRVCGRTSGRDTDKIGLLRLSAERGETVKAPAFLELPLTLECKVLYRKMQDAAQIGNDIKARFYPPDVDGREFGSNRDYHIAYMGEIVNAYILEK